MDGHYPASCFDPLSCFTDISRFKFYSQLPLRTGDPPLWPFKSGCTMENVCAEDCSTDGYSQTCLYLDVGTGKLTGNDRIPETSDPSSNRSYKSPQPSTD